MGAPVLMLKNRSKISSKPNEELRLVGSFCSVKLECEHYWLGERTSAAIAVSAATAAASAPSVVKTDCSIVKTDFAVQSKQSLAGMLGTYHRRLPSGPDVLYLVWGESRPFTATFPLLVVLIEAAATWQIYG